MSNPFAVPVPKPPPPTSAKRKPRDRRRRSSSRPNVTKTMQPSSPAKSPTISSNKTNRNVENEPVSSSRTRVVPTVTSALVNARYHGLPVIRSKMFPTRTYFAGVYYRPPSHQVLDRVLTTLSKELEHLSVERKNSTVDAPNLVCSSAAIPSSSNNKNGEKETINSAPHSSRLQFPMQPCAPLPVASLV